MARPLRIEIAGGRYHFTARGNERGEIFKDDRDRGHFLELLSRWPERFGVKLHAYVLMPNHYHLLLETPEPNLSRAGQWLNVSYSVWFNRRHERSGHLLQGRFKAVLIEGDGQFQEVGRYVHLNPVRVSSLGLSKAERRASRIGLAPAPSAEVVTRRLRVLRGWKWSSYRAYAGYEAVPTWLTSELLGKLSGGRTEKQRRAALREYTESSLREGLPEKPWEHLIGGLILGSKSFAESLKIKGDPREQSRVRELKKAVRWDSIVEAVEKVKGEQWKDFCDRHGDWGRDAALWIGRHAGRLKLRELAQRAGGLDYTAIGAAVSRFGRRVSSDPVFCRIAQQIQNELSKVEI